MPPGQLKNKFNKTSQEPRDSRRIVVFTGKWFSASTVESVEAISRGNPDWQIMVVQGPGRRVGTLDYLRGKLRRLKREPISYPMELMSEAVGRVSFRFARRHVGGQVKLPALCDLSAPNVSYHRCDSLHDEDVLDAVRQFRPWLGISLGAPILKSALFSIPQAGTINIHKSLLPEYRGMPPGFWELHDGAETTGVSIHWMAAGLDTGRIIDQVPYQIPQYVTPGGIGPALDEIGIRLLMAVLEKLSANDVEGIAQTVPQTPTRSRPAFLLYQRVRKRLAAKRSPIKGAVSKLRNLVKKAVLGAYVYIWAPIRNLWRRILGTAHVTILLYHRVDDNYLDDVSVGVEQFREHLSVLKKNYDVLDIEEFLRSRGNRRSRPAVVVTFDDGYQSAFLAARILRRAGLPAAFFVSTGIVGTDRAFPHDTDKLGKCVPALSWDEVYTMSEWGFHVGPHTVNHVNLGKVALQEAREELATAISDITSRLGNMPACAWLAYPHGKKTDITDEVKSLLPDMGVTHCLSAYGGVNGPSFDPGDIKRQGVDWKYSTLSLRAVVEGWRIR